MRGAARGKPVALPPRPALPPVLACALSLWASCAAVLAASGREGKFPMVCMASLVLFALGACIAILAGNAFLVPVLAVGFMLAPFWYVKLTAGSFKKDVAAELETALSVITTAYLRTENFQRKMSDTCTTRCRRCSSGF